MSDNKLDYKLIEIFDKLNDRYSNLNTNIEKLIDKLKSDLINIPSVPANITEIKNTISQLQKDVQNIKETSNRISTILDELLAYKNNIQDIPKETFELCHKILAEVLKINETPSDIKDYTAFHKDLKAIATFSKLVSTPLGITTAIVAFILSIATVTISITKLIKDYYPLPKTTIVQNATPSNPSTSPTHP